MLTYPIPENEEVRLKALLDLHILDTPPEERFDAITRVAQRLFDVETVTVTLIDASRQWFKSRVGMEAQETPREESICAHAIMGNTILNIDDASKDFRFRNFPCVKGSPFIRLYVGCPLKAIDGSNLGTLCLIHSKPRSLSEKELSILKDLASIVEYHLNSKVVNESLEKLWRTEKALKEKDLLYKTLVDSTTESILVLDYQGYIQAFNFASEKMFGYSAKECINKNIHMLFPLYTNYELNSFIQTSSKSESGSSTLLPMQVTCQKKNGNIFSGEMTRSKMSFEDKDLYIWILREQQKK